MDGIQDVQRRVMPAASTESRFLAETYRAADTGDTVDLVVSVGSAWPRTDWMTGERYIETLDISAGAIRMDRLNAGAPLLTDHVDTVDNVVGVVERAWVAGGELRATVRFGGHDRARDIAQRVREGILRNVSTRYLTHRVRVIPASGERALPERRATDWEPLEVSFVAIPVDAGAGVRAAGLPQAECEFTFNRAPIAHIEEVGMADNSQESGALAPVDETRAAPAAGTAPDVEAIRAAERDRIAEITSRCRALNLAHDFADELVRSGASVDAAARKMLDELARKQVRAPAGPTVEVVRDHADPTQVIEAMADALAVRAMPGSFKPTNDRFREFSSLRPSDMLMELAAARGERVSPRDRMALLERSFHTTSDFPLLLENAGNKMLMAGFMAAAPSYRAFFAQRSFNDFKAHRFLMAGDFPALAELNEGGAITAGTISEKRETVTPKTFARQIRITRQALVNDDLGAFTDFGAMIGRRVADQENALAYALVNTASGDGPTLTTGNAAVFGTGATRANKASGGAAITETALDLGYAAMMAQTSLDGIRLNIQPRILLTGAAYRGAALRFTTRISPEAGANVGLYSDLTPVADANITGNRWYLFADPAAAPVYVYGYVNGQTAPQVRVHRWVPGTDGLAVEVVHDFAVGAVDHRGGYFNPGG
jgi:hypothetical protein